MGFVTSGASEGEVSADDGAAELTAEAETSAAGIAPDALCAASATTLTRWFDPPDALAEPLPERAGPRAQLATTRYATQASDVFAERRNDAESSRPKP